MQEGTATFFADGIINKLDNNYTWDNFEKAFKDRFMSTDIAAEAMTKLLILK